MPKQYLPLIAVSLLFVGCASTRSLVAMKVDDKTAHVNLGANEVKIGDRFTVYKNKCIRPPARLQGVNNDPVCNLVPVGSGRISEVLGEHYSVLSLEPGSSISEGDTVEKQ